MAKATKAYADAALTRGVTPEKLAHLNWGTFFIHNLVPVTLGNIVGGGLFWGEYIGLFYRGNKRIAAKQSAA